MRWLRIRALLVFFLFLLSAIAFLDRTNISIAGVQISNEYRLGNIHLGWVFSAFLVGYAVFQIPAGWLAVHLGPRRVLAAGVLWWGVFTAMTAMVPAGASRTLWLLIAVRFALGAGEAVVYPASNQFVARWIPALERGRANGWIFAGVGAGAGLTPPILAAVIAHYGWRASFWLSAAIGVAAGAVWYVIARDAPEQHPSVSASELNQIRAGLTLATENNAPPPKLTWRAIASDRNVFLLAASYFCFGYVAWVFFSWFYLYMAQARGLDLKASARFTMLPFLAMTVCCLFGGVANDWLTRRYGPRTGRCGLGVLSLSLAACFLVLGSTVASANLAGMILAGGAGALYLSQSSYWSVSADIAGPHAGIVSGVMNMGAQAGGAVTASLTPWIAARFGWTSAFITAAFLAVLGALGWLFVNPAEKLRDTAHVESDPISVDAPARP